MRRLHAPSFFPLQIQRSLRPRSSATSRSIRTSSMPLPPWSRSIRPPRLLHQVCFSVFAWIMPARYLCCTTCFISCCCWRSPFGSAKNAPGNTPSVLIHTHLLLQRPVSQPHVYAHADTILLGYVDVQIFWVPGSQQQVQVALMIC
jgi:hypothetical protein